MHAASVHPEPGSNSRMFVFNLAMASSNHFECYLSFSYFCLSCICSLRNFRVPFSHILICLYFSLRCSIFNDRFAAFFATALLLYHITFLLSIGFLKKIKKIFSTAFLPLSCARIYNNVEFFTRLHRGNLDFLFWRFQIIEFLSFLKKITMVLRFSDRLAGRQKARNFFKKF